jgi:glycosyltransferase involved in cell wall biosynthesis
MVGLDSSEYGWRYQRLFQAPGSTALCVAEHLTRRVLEAGVPPDRAATFHLGIDLAEYEPPERAPHGSTLRVALVGRLMPVKGHATALRAFAGVARARPGSILELFGEGELEPSLRRLAGELGVADSVHFRGVVPVDVLRQELSRADVALQPSQIDPQGRIEGIPNATLEAMALALPVVATRHGGIPEAVRDGETGFLVPERDPAALEGRLMELAAAPERRLEMGRAARKRIEEEFALGAQGRHLSKHLENAARRYDEIPADTRRRQWRLATPGLLDRSGRRDRARWWALTQLNRIRGRVP